jgi:hypothetical protein
MSKTEAHVGVDTLNRVVRFLTDTRCNKTQAAIRLKISARYGAVGGIERIGRRWSWIFDQYPSSPETVVAWLMMLLHLDVDSKSNPRMSGREASNDA